MSVPIFYFCLMTIQFQNFNKSPVFIDGGTDGFFSMMSIVPHELSVLTFVF